MSRPDSPSRTSHLSGTNPGKRRGFVTHQLRRGATLIEMVAVAAMIAIVAAIAIATWRGMPAWSQQQANLKDLQTLNEAVEILRWETNSQSPALYGNNDVNQNIAFLAAMQASSNNPLKGLTIDPTQMTSTGSGTSFRFLSYRSGAFAVASSAGGSGGVTVNDTSGTVDPTDYVLNAYLITQLTGGTSASLDGMATASLTIGRKIIVGIGGTEYLYELAAGTNASNPPNIVQPTDFDPSANPRVWVLRSYYDMLHASMNLADLTDASAAQSNLGLGDMALQFANNVAISGGTASFSENGLQVGDQIQTLNNTVLLAGRTSGSMIGGTTLLAAESTIGSGLTFQGPSWSYTLLASGTAAGVGANYFSIYDNTSSAYRMVLSPGGLFGFGGVLNPDAGVVIRGSGSSDIFGLQNASGTRIFTVNSSGNVAITGGVSATGTVSAGNLQATSLVSANLLSTDVNGNLVANTSSYLPITGGILTGPLAINVATPAISPSTGALVINGNIGLGGDGSAYFASGLHANSLTSLSGSDLTLSTSSSGNSIHLNTSGSSSVFIGGSSNSISSTSGSLIIGNLTGVTSVGVGGGNINAGGIIRGAGLQDTAIIGATFLGTDSSGNLINAGTAADARYVLKAGDTMTGALNINLDTSGSAPGLQGFSGSLVADFVTPDGSAGRMFLDSFGGGPNLVFRRADGTDAAKSALQSGDSIGGVGGAGYGATSYSTNTRWSIYASAIQNWSNSAQGTEIHFQTTPLGSIVNADAATLGGDGLGQFYVVDAVAATSAITGAISTPGGISAGNTSFFGNTVSVSTNTTALPAATAPILHLGGANGTLAYTYQDSFGAGNVIAMRRAQGTAAAPTAVTAGVGLGSWQGWGWDGGAYGAAGYELISANETWTSTSHGGALAWYYVPNGGQVNAVAGMVLSNDGHGQFLVEAATAASGAGTGAITTPGGISANGASWFGGIVTTPGLQDTGIISASALGTDVNGNIIAIATGTEPYVLRAGDTMTGPLTISTNSSTLPGSALFHTGAAAGTVNIVMQDAYGGSAVFPEYLFRNGGGTIATPAAVTAGTILGLTGYFGTYDTSGTFQQSGQIIVKTTENWSATTQGSQFFFNYTPTGTVNRNLNGAILSKDGAGQWYVSAATAATSAITGAISTPGGVSTGAASFFGAPIAVSANTSALPGLQGASGTLGFEVAAPDGAYLRNILETFGSGVSPILTFRSAGGTNASPSTTPTGQSLGTVTWTGYANGAYLSTSQSAIDAGVLNPWTSLDHSSTMVFSNTHAGSTSRTNDLSISGDGAGQLKVFDAAAATGSGLGAITTPGGISAGAASWFGATITAPSLKVTGILNASALGTDGSGNLISVATGTEPYVLRAGDTMTGALTIQPATNVTPFTVFGTTSQTSPLAEFGTNGSGAFYIDSNGNIILNGQTPGGGLNPYTSIHSNAAQDILLNANGGSYLYLQASSGRVGVGTEAPNATLAVNGTLSSSGTAGFGGNTTVTGTFSVSSYAYFNGIIAQISGASPYGTLGSGTRLNIMNTDTTDANNGSQVVFYDGSYISAGINAYVPVHGASGSTVLEFSTRTGGTASPVGAFTAAGQLDVYSSAAATGYNNGSGAIFTAGGIAAAGASFFGSQVTIAPGTNQSDLVVYGTSSQVNGIAYFGTGGGNALVIDNHGRIDLNNFAPGASVLDTFSQIGTNGGQDLLITANNGSYIYLQDSTSRVGIATNVPTSTLSVNGTFNVASTTLLTGATTISPTSGSVVPLTVNGTASQTGNLALFETAGGGVLAIDNQGNIILNSQVPGSNVLNTYTSIHSNGGQDIRLDANNGAFLYLQYATSRAGIGTTTPSSTLTVNGTFNAISTGAFGGSVTAPNFNSTSSRRYKENIRPLDNALSDLLALRGVTFDWKQGSPHPVAKNDIGFIAEEVDRVIPQVVAHDSTGVVEGLDYGRLTPVLVEAIRSINTKVDSLQKEETARKGQSGLAANSVIICISIVGAFGTGIISGALFVISRKKGAAAGWPQS